MKRREVIQILLAGVPALGMSSLTGDTKGGAAVITRVPEAQRKRIYWDGVAAEHRALIEAHNQFPRDPVRMARLESSLLERYQSKVWKAAGLTSREFLWIVQEGFDKSWPCPPTPSLDAARR